MLAANPERTSWTAEQVDGGLDPVWYKPIEPFIPQKVQIIAANNTLYIATASGLYALDAATGAEKWVYATEFPLGHSPTIDNNVAYVGGHDRMLHAVNALTGQGLWTFEAGAGFETNPLVVGDKVYLGNRDGYFYAIYADGAPGEGTLAWKYKTDGPILYSAAYKDGVVFFASNDSHAYALNANTGQLVWKSAKLPGAGFYSWWPVVYQDRVIFSGSENYSSVVESSVNSGNMAKIELSEIYEANNISPGDLVGSLSKTPGDWATGTPTINASLILNYFANKPYRRTVFVLNRSTGVEEETAPVLWAGTRTGSRYPPVIGVDGVLYQQNDYMSSDVIAGGQIAGWQPGVNYISVVSSDWAAVDEPHAYAAGGNLIYWNLCCDRQTGMFDVTQPNSDFYDNYMAGDRPPTGSLDKNRERMYVNYDLSSQIPGYNSFWYSPHSLYTKPYASFGGINGSMNGVYGFHGDTNPPIPYNGMVYTHRSNVIIAFADTTSAPTALSTATIGSAPSANISPLGVEYLKTELADEIQKMLDAGHLRPAYTSHGLFDKNSASACGDDLVEYWHNSAETIYTLSLAYPYLSSTQQQAVLSYLQSEYNNYPPYYYNHIGWDTGAAREVFDMPPDVEADLGSGANQRQIDNPTFNNNGGTTGEGVWKRNPFVFYALWKYAEIAGNPLTIWLASESDFWVEFNSQPSDTLLVQMPLIHNAYIAGYVGYLELESLAGQPESTNVRNELDRLMQLRANNFTKDTVYTNMDQPYCRTLSVASNFMFLVPELAVYLRDNAMSQVTAALNEYDALAPYWFVSFFSGGYGENAITPLYDAHALFMARAYILEEPGEELEKYIDVPAFATGDLYYIHKLVVALDGQSPGFTLSAAPFVQSIETGGNAAFTIDIQPTGGFAETVNLAATDPPDINVNLTPATFNNLPGQSMLTLTDSSSSPAARWYEVTITATGGGIEKTTIVNLLVNGWEMYLPSILKSN